MYRSTSATNDSRRVHLGPWCRLSISTRGYPISSAIRLQSVVFPVPLPPATVILWGIPVREASAVSTQISLGVVACHGT